jgi:putative DNA primase/helicase
MNVQQYECDDIGNKDRFRDWHNGNAKFIREQKRWVYYDNGWHYADIFKLTEPVVRNIFKEIAESPGGPTQETINWAKVSQSKSYQRTILEYASSFMGFSINDFDANPKLINCKNGVLNLESKELSPHSQGQLHLKQVSANYDDKAQCPRWIQFLFEIFNNDTELMKYIHIALGYSIMGLTKEHLFFLCYGNGRNGKGVLLETIADILGTYSTTVEFETFLQRQVSVRVLEAIGRLKGQRFITASETSNSTQLNEALIKRLTGGDTLVGTKLHGDSFEFKPTHTLWFACNHLPTIKDASLAMWERVIVIPFDKTFLGEQQEKDLKEIMKAEADGIFRWLVGGAYGYLENGLPTLPDAISKAVRDYRDLHDKLSVFVRECMWHDGLRNVNYTKEQLNAFPGVDTIYDAYVLWCGDKETPIPKFYFSSNMGERGIHKKKAEKGMVFPGWYLK